MNLLIIGAVAGGLSGAAGYFLAEKIHGKERIEAIYPAYAAALFIALVIISRFVVI